MTLTGASASLNSEALTLRRGNHFPFFITVSCKELSKSSQLCGCLTKLYPKFMLTFNFIAKEGFIRKQ